MDFEQFNRKKRSNRYRAGMILLGIMLCFTLLVFFQAAFDSVQSAYSSTTQEIVINLKKTFLRDTVNNIVDEIQSERAYRHSVYWRMVRAKRNYFETEPVFSTLNERNFFIHQFAIEDSEIKNLWTALLVENHTGNVIYALNNEFDEVSVSNVEALKPFLLAYEVVEMSGYTGIYGVSYETLDEIVKKDMLERIRAFEFNDNNTYLWVNEIIDFEGGDDYAVRVLHQYLPETEGQLLSTNTRDALGRFPYYEELEGVKWHGDIFFNYYFARPEDGKPAEKITYAKLYEDYRWVIAMGAYKEDFGELETFIDQESEDILRNVNDRLLGALFGLLAVWIVGIFLFEEKRHTTAQADIERELSCDSLTGALNRRGGKASLEILHEGFQYDNYDVALMIFDVDNFKQINDQYGHAVGDLALAEVVSVVRRNIRNTDKLIRWGGDEFVVIFMGLGVDNIPNVGKKIVEDMAEMSVQSEAGAVKPTISMGFSVLRHTDESYVPALERADEALYLSKEMGRNTFNTVL